MEASLVMSPKMLASPARERLPALVSPASARRVPKPWMSPSDWLVSEAVKWRVPPASAMAPSLMLELPVRVRV
jgi:hypothetical protein